MSSRPGRRLARLEKSIAGHHKIKETVEASADAEMANQAIIHAANLAVFVIYGEPKIGEPLTMAWRRIRHKMDSLPDPCDPFKQKPALFMSLLARQDIIAKLPGGSEREKLDQVFASASPWLIWFTYGDFTADVLGLSLPDLTPVRKFVRAREFVDIWPALPRDAFECKPWPDGSLDETFTDDDREFLRKGLGVSHDDMSKRERERAIRAYVSLPKKRRSISWPPLPGNVEP